MECLYGIKYYPALRCPDSPTGDYLTLVTTNIIAQKEMEITRIVQSYIPNGAIYVEHVCECTPIKHYDTCLYYKHGIPIHTYISDLKTSVASNRLTPQKINVFSELIDALRKLRIHIREMNAKGFSHNAISEKTIVYNEILKTAYLTHFDQAGYVITDDDETITTILHDQSNYMSVIKAAFY